MAQSVSNSRTRIIVFKSDTTLLDSLSLIPNTINLYDSTGQRFSSELYQINEAKSLCITSKIRGKVTVSYKVFSVNYSKPYFHKQQVNYISHNPDSSKTFTSFFGQNKDVTGDKIETNGSISKGLMIGNNQNVILNSSLNLQITGELSHNLKIEGAISDNNIPIQPSGNSQQIQDFNNIYIKLYNANSRVLFGDFEIRDEYCSLLKYIKKGEGIEAKTTFSSGDTKTIIEGSFAVSKGIKSQKTFQGIEGNQGPYKLYGNNNELYIIVLSSSEKVYIDGQLKKRGEDFDYTIDYNNAEITFTPNNPINKNNRIAVEFEYSDNNYSRFMISTNDIFITKKSKTWVSILSEQDDKNQPLLFSLSQGQKDTLAKSGNSPAYEESAKLDTTWNQNVMYYVKVDTIVNGKTYQIFRYTTVKSNTVYNVTYSFVGNGSGTYGLANSNANGRVFEWVAPNSDGSLNGSYLPVTVIPAPQKKQVIDLGNMYNISKYTKSTIEMGISNNDLNEFTPNNNIIGTAIKVGLEQKIPLNTPNQFFTAEINQSYIDKNFNPFDKYKSIEFERDWNIQDTKQADEYHTICNLKNQLAIGESGYSFEYLDRLLMSTGYKNSIFGNLHKYNFFLVFSASAMHSNDTVNTTQFNRYKATLSKRIKKFTSGVNSEYEDRQWKNDKNILSPLSNGFISNKVFISRTDSSKWNLIMSAQARTDKAVDSLHSKLTKSDQSYDYDAQLGLNKNPNNTLKFIGHYRILTPLDSLSQKKRENSVTGRLEHKCYLLNKFINSTMFYQLGSGVEAKQSYSYIQVADGQGVYEWIDYNKDGRPELNEFEIAPYQYLANYIKIFTPTNEYITTISNQFSEMLILEPKKILKSKSKTATFFSRFSNQTNYKSSFKTTDRDFIANANPFRKLPNDTALVNVSSSFRNTIYFNRTQTKFNLNYNYRNDFRKELTVNGWEQHHEIGHTINERCDIINSISEYLTVEQGLKTTNIEAISMANQTYDITYYMVTPKLTWQPTLYYSMDIFYTYENQKNINSEDAIKNSVGNDIKISSKENGSLTFQVKYIQLSYNALPNTALAYTMLEGLQPGTNFIWTSNYQKKMSKNLLVRIQYQGQKSEGLRIIHTGSIQFSAYF